MDKTRFCHCCRVHHPESQMRRLTTRQGERWRCLASIAAARRSAGERDEFGRVQTAINREAARRAAEHASLLRQHGLA